MNGKRLLGCVLVVTLSLGFAACSSASKKCGAACATCQENDTRVRHVVVFKYKDTVPPEQVNEITKVFLDLPDKIPGIECMEWGTNISPENLNKGLTHCYLLTFKDAAARDAYLPHPEHKAFGKLLSGKLEDVFVIDYTPQK